MRLSLLSRTDNSARWLRLIFYRASKSEFDDVLDELLQDSKQNRIVYHTRAIYTRAHFILTPVNEGTCVARRTQNASEKAPRRRHRLSRLPTPWRTVHQARISRNVLACCSRRTRVIQTLFKNRIRRYIFRYIFRDY